MSIARENQELGPFRLLRLLGAGGMGEVWLAQDLRLLRPVAIKILPQNISASPDARARLMREAQLAAQLNHPSIATIHAIEEAEGCLLVAMEFVDGQALSSSIRNRELSDHDVVRIARDIAEALGEAHDRGIVHRDIKPDNVMISGRRVKVLDFGIAKRVGAGAAAAASGEFRTQQGIVVGTIEYMSPEQALGDEVDARTDIFSLGVLLYHALSGTLPFTGATPTEVLIHICRDQPRPFSSVRPDIPQEVVQVISRCLEKDRERRYANGHELATALEELFPRMSRTAAPTIGTPMIPGSGRKMPEAEPIAPPAPVVNETQVIPGERMLMADDDAAVRSLFAALAAREGVACDTVANGHEAIAALKRREYTLLFLDIMMPRIDGWGVIDYMRGHPELHLPKTFIVTGFHDQTVSTADKEIVSGILYKPVDAEDVAMLIRQCIRGGAIDGVLRKTKYRMLSASH